MVQTPAWAGEAFCYVTTRGRRSGRPHRIEIWFGWSDGSLYLLSGGGEHSDWVRNLVAEPAVTVRVGNEEFPANARLLTDASEEEVARRLLASKYQGWREGEAMTGWARTALPVALDPSF